MRPYLGPPWTNSCQIWCGRVFHHVLLKYCHENAEMQKRKFDDITLQYSIESHMWPQQTWGQRSSGVNDLWFKFLKKGSLYPHTVMYFCGTWTQWSLGRVTYVTSTDLGSKVILWSMTFGSCFWKNGHCIHILWCSFQSNITMIAKVCDRESRRDSWFENRLVRMKERFIWSKSTKELPCKIAEIMKKTGFCGKFHS